MRRLVWLLGLAAAAAQSCSDGTMNQDEEGVDCGGVCGRCVCEADADCAAADYCLQLPTTLTYSPEPSWSYGQPTVFDADEDGDVDFLFTRTSSQYGYWENTGSQDFPTPTEVTSASGTPFEGTDLMDVGRRSLAPGDIDGDGDEDLLAVHQTTDTFEFWRREGGVFVSADADSPADDSLLETTSSYSHYIALTDVNADGDLDLVLAHLRDVTVYLGTGSMSFASSPAHSLTVGAYAIGMDACDYDGDGDEDLLVGQFTPGSSWQAAVRQVSIFELQDSSFELVSTSSTGGDYGYPQCVNGLASTRFGYLKYRDRDLGVQVETDWGKCVHETPLRYCDNGEQDDGETDVDCGGDYCDKCDDGAACEGGPDCASGVCVSGLCWPAECDDGIFGADETDVDCGDLCPPCAAGGVCWANSDCVSTDCTFSACLASTEVGAACYSDSDCEAMVCSSGGCAVDDGSDSSAGSIGVVVGALVTVGVLGAVWWWRRRGRTVATGPSSPSAGAGASPTKPKPKPKPKQTALAAPPPAYTPSFQADQLPVATAVPAAAVPMGVAVPLGDEALPVARAL